MLAVIVLGSVIRAAKRIGGFPRDNMHPSKGTEALS